MVTGKCLPDFQEDILGRVFGLSFVAQHAVGQPEYFFSELLDQQIESLVVPPGFQLPPYLSFHFLTTFPLYCAARLRVSKEYL